jgi:hypothetical protein
MENIVKSKFLNEVTLRFGKLESFGNSRSLFRIQGSDVRLYLRYSKIHSQNQAFYGIRAKDLKQIEGFPSFICLLWEGQDEPVIIPYSDYEDVFQTATLADDGQYKVLLFLQKDVIELYIAKAGRFNIEGCLGWSQLEIAIKKSNKSPIPDLSHSQIQTLLGAIGCAKDFDIWIPPADRPKMDWSIAKQFNQRGNLPYGFETVSYILSEIDVIWLKKGSNTIQGLFEVEHSTPIYSGLLRFNDIHLVAPNLKTRFSIVANNERRSLFVKQIHRPTFQTSGLGELCTFLEYSDVFNWHKRIGDINA